MMYRVAKRLPDIEKFGLASQVRRAALSLTNNIAEGHGRYHFLDQIKFMLQSRGSLEELIDDLNVCEDEQYLPVDEIASLKTGLAITAADRWFTYAICVIKRTQKALLRYEEPRQPMMTLMG